MKKLCDICRREFNTSMPTETVCPSCVRQMRDDARKGRLNPRKPAELIPEPFEKNDIGTRLLEMEYNRLAINKNQRSRRINKRQTAIRLQEDSKKRRT